jgi:hypothetical protein
MESNAREGIMCMKKSIICLKIVSPGLKASKANVLMKSIAKMQIILGNQ